MNLPLDPSHVRHRGPPSPLNSMVLSRTRAHLAYRFKLAIFKAGRLHEALDEAEQRDLEAHMGFRGQWEEHRRFQMELAKSFGLRQNSSLLEIGCGPLTFGLPAIAYLDANRYVGVDVRSNVLDLAWSQVGKAGLADKNPKLLHSRSFGAEELGHERFDFIWSFSVLYHLTDPLLNDCFAQIAQRLAPQGSYFANLNVEQPESEWLEFPFVKRNVEFYREAARRNGLAMTELGTLQSLGFRLDFAEKTNVLVKIAPA
jgi:2-polyprenyl-3-methyl-5-hydroxy-6-metoxy-1,4-benzoquinol methylase